MAQHILSRIQSPGPKRILALDGGGIRGAVTIGFLKKIEHILRERHGNPSLVLSDYFDLVGGTSTGAIIATLLALGKPTEEIEGLYRTLGPKIFEKNIPCGTRLTGGKASGTALTTDPWKPSSATSWVM